MCLCCKQIVYCKHLTLIARVPRQFFILILLTRWRVIKEGCLSRNDFWEREEGMIKRELKWVCVTWGRLGCISSCNLSSWRCFTGVWNRPLRIFWFCTWWLVSGKCFLCEWHHPPDVHGELLSISSSTRIIWWKLHWTKTQIYTLTSSERGWLEARRCSFISNSFKILMYAYEKCSKPGKALFYTRGKI